MPERLLFDINGADPTPDQLQAARADRYRQRHHLRVSSEEEALDFLNDVGLCSLFSAKGIEIFAASAMLKKSARAARSAVGLLGRASSCRSLV